MDNSNNNYTRSDKKLLWSCDSILRSKDIVSQEEHASAVTRLLSIKAPCIRISTKN